MKEFKFELGDKVKDIVTGITGHIMARSEFITGCDQYGISPKVGKDGKRPDWEYFDENRLVKVAGKITLPKDKKRVVKGFDGNHPDRF